ncbi:MAG: alpha-galactosidase [Nocardioidaceae bacterium]|jgi:alpha-galactosidase|nr:alpha-galactosidase [Nocardioidaceae bacterium]
MLTPLTLAGTGSPAVADTDRNHLALTPPMGWSNWDAFSPRTVTAQDIRAITDKMAALGMRHLGYKYIIVGSGWQARTRATDGEMQADGTKFPGGMKALADYVHSKGFKFGLQQAPGMQNCPGWPAPGTGTAPGATYAQRAKFDAKTFASWGVDFIRLDGCDYQNMRPARLTARAWARRVYGKWRNALDATGRNIVYWGNGHEYATPEMWAPIGLNAWRIRGDLHPCWESVLQGIDTNAPLAALAGPGHWNDPDFLALGTPRSKWPNSPCFVGGLTNREGRSQFSLWAITAAPLVASTDLKVDSPFTIKTLTNQAVIAVDQDPLGRQGQRIRTNGQQEVWVKRLANGDRAVVLFNRSTTRATVSTSASEIGMPAASRYFLDSLWSHCVSSTTGSISSSLGRHSVSMMRVSLRRTTGWPRCA